MKPEDFRYEDFKWKKGMLYLGQEYVGVSIRQDMNNPKMYSLITDEGEIGDYNLTRAKDNGIKIVLEDIRKGGVHKGVRRASDALNAKKGTDIA